MWDKTHVIYVIQPYCFPFLLLVLSIIPKRKIIWLECHPYPPFFYMGSWLRHTKNGDNDMH